MTEFENPPEKAAISRAGQPLDGHSRLDSDASLRAPLGEATDPQASNEVAADHAAQAPAAVAASEPKIPSPQSEDGAPSKSSAFAFEPWFHAVFGPGRPNSKFGYLVRFTLVGIGFGLAIRSVNEHLGPLLRARPAPALHSDDGEGSRFGLAEARRKEIFTVLAAYEVPLRARAIQLNTWDGHLWSREDDRGQDERMFMRSLEVRYGVSLSQIYLVLDEGIHQHWPGPDGKPLVATTPPHNPRTGR